MSAAPSTPAANGRNLRRNIRLLYAENLLSNASFTLPIYILFGTSYLGLNIFRAGSFLLVALVVSILCDFWGGVAADRFGRKRIFAIGTALQVGFCLSFLLTRSYDLLLLASVVEGIGLALAQNSIDALLYEQAAEANQEKAFQHANANTQIFAFVGRIGASLGGGLAFKLDPHLPYLLTALALLGALTAGLLTRFPKHLDQHIPDGTPKWQAVKQSVGTYASNPALIKFVVVMGLASVGADLLFTYYQPFYIGKGVSAATLGVVFAVVSACSALGSWAMRRLPDHVSGPTITSIALAAIAAEAALLYVLPLPFALAAPAVLGVASGFTYPNLRLYVNKRVANRNRAAVLSVATTLVSLGSAAGLGIGFYLADRWPAARILLLVMVGTGLVLAANVSLKARDTHSSPVSVT